MKKHFIILLVLLLIIASAFGCEKEEESAVTDCGGYINFDSSEDLLKAWYSVQKGHIERVEIPKTDEENDNNIFISSFKDQPQITIPISKNDNYPLHSISAYETSVQYSFCPDDASDGFYIIIVSETARLQFDAYTDGENVTMIDGNIYKKTYDGADNWIIDLVHGYVRITFPKDIDGSDYNTIFEYFDFNQINIVEYESQMK